MSDLDQASAEPPLDDKPSASTSKRRPILLTVSLVILAAGVVAAITGTLAKSTADEDRDAAKRELQVSVDEVARAETALSNSEEGLEFIEGESRANLQIAVESAGTVDRLLAINERQVAVFREQRDLSLAPGGGIDRYNELSTEANTLADEYNGLIDELNRIRRETTPGSLDD